jgi:hypothetical protein
MLSTVGADLCFHPKFVSQTTVSVKNITHSTVRNTVTNKWTLQYSIVCSIALVHPLSVLHYLPYHPLTSTVLLVDSTVQFSCYLEES